MIRLLAIDMDGTCLDDRKMISEKNMRALKAAARAGITVVPTTGRALSCIPHQLKNETFYRYVISSNGAVVTDSYTGRDLYRALIPCEEAAAFLRRCEEIKVGITAHLHHDFVVQGHALQMLGKLSYGKDAANTWYSRDVPALLLTEKADVEEIQLFFFTEGVEKKTRALLNEYDCYLKAFSSHYVELYSQKASKGNGLAALAEQLHISTEEIACIGDAENDLSMFAVSGMKFAMGNSIDALKERADYTVSSNRDSGVAEAIQKYLL